MYVVGFELGKWRIEKRYLDSGDLVTGTDDFDDGVVISEDTWGEANAIAVDPPSVPPLSASMYVVGRDYTGDNYRWRIEKRLLSNGSLVEAFDGDGVVFSDPSGNNDAPYGIAIHGYSIYVVGSDRSPGASDAQWRIEKRNCESGLLEDVIVDNFSVDDDIPYAIAIDGTYMYVVGYDRNTGLSSRRGRGNRISSNAQWRIEKRLLAGLVLQGSVNSNPTDDFDIASGIAIDGTHMYVIGFDQLGFFDTEWRIEKRWLSTTPTPLSLDDTVYPVPEGFRGFGDDDDGIIRANYREYGPDQPTAIAIYGSHMYVAGFSSDIGSGDTAWRIEKRDLEFGDIVDIATPSGDIPAIVVNDIDSEDNDKAFAIAVDGTYMYVAGYSTNSRFSDDLPACLPPYPPVCLPDDLPDWRIVKRELGDLSLDLLEHIESVLPPPPPEGGLRPLAPQDLPPVVPLVNGEEFRLKMLLHVGTEPPSVPPVPLPSNFYQFKLQYSDNDTDFFDITDQTPDFSEQSPIVFKDNPIASDGTTIIGSGGGFDPLHSGHFTSFQTYEEANNFTNSVSEILDGQDGMWDFSLYVTDAADSGTYSFRIVRDVDGTAIPLNFYNKTPVVTVP